MKCYSEDYFESPQDTAVHQTFDAIRCLKKETSKNSSKSAQHLTFIKVINVFCNRDIWFPYEWQTFKFTYSTINILERFPLWKFSKFYLKNGTFLTPKFFAISFLLNLNKFHQIRPKKAKNLWHKWQKNWLRQFLANFTEFDRIRLKSNKCILQ